MTARTRIAAPRRGQAITGRFLTNLDARVGELEARLAAPRWPGGEGALETQGANAVGFDRMTVTGEQTNHVIATPSGGGSVNVAKPWPLRGAIATRTVSGEVQIILPTYTEAPTILAIQVGEALTGLAGVEWLEISTRLWAAEHVPP